MTPQTCSSKTSSSHSLDWVTGISFDLVFSSPLEDKRPWPCTILVFLLGSTLEIFTRVSAMTALQRSQ